MEIKVQNMTNTDHSLYVKLPIWRKVTFGLIDMANNFSWSLVSSYLAVFYTDIFLVPTTAVSILFIVARLWDAINDPLVGTLADRTHSRMGRFRPWILFSCVPMVLMTIVTFTAFPNWSNPAKVAYIFITYGILVFAYTCVNIPYSAMTSAITQDPKERGSLASYRLTFAVAGNLIVTQVIARLYPKLSEATTPAHAYQLCAVILGAFAIILYMIGVFTHKEIVKPTAKQITNKMPFMKMAKYALQDRVCVIAIIAHFVYGFCGYGRSATFIYYFTYVQNNAALMGTWIFFQMIPTIIGTFTGQFLAQKLRNKGKVLSFSGIGMFIVLMIQYFLVPYYGFAFLCGTTIIFGLLNGWSSSMSYAIIPDLTEVGQLRSGIRMDGFYSSFTSFLNKAGIALGTSGVVALIGWAGYIPNTVQNATVIGVMNAFMFLIPAIIYLFMGILFLWYDLSFDRFEKILAQIQENERTKTGIEE